MRQSMILLAVGLLIGFALSALWREPAPPASARMAPQPGTAETPAAATADARLAEIERRLAAGEQAQAALAAALTRLQDGLHAEMPDDVRAGDRPPEDAAREALAGTEPHMPPGPRMRGANRLERLVAAGFSPDRAEAIERRLEALQLDAMQARYEAARQGDSIDAPTERFFDTTAALRTELGEADYERYRSALGLPTAVDVTNVLSGSAAERAGILSGDQIVAYAGARVFDVRELNQALLEGESGDTVLVDIVRAGQPMQIAIERGPLGISSGFPGPGGRFPR